MVRICDEDKCCRPCKTEHIRDLLSCDNDIVYTKLFVHHGPSGPLSSMLTNRFGFQLVVMTGGLLISAGTIATSFTSSVNQMYITYGLIAGINLLS